MRSEDLKQEAEGLWQNAKNMKQQVLSNQMFLIVKLLHNSILYSGTLFRSTVIKDRNLNFM